MMPERVCAGCQRILVVEDEATLRIPMHDYLEGKGARVTSVGTGDEALAELGRRDFDMVFTDIRLPGPDGFRVLGRALEVSPQTCVVLMTAYADVPSAVRGIRSGAFDFLPKPFAFELLDAVLVRHCRQHRFVLERDQLLADAGAPGDIAEIAACSPQMKTVLETVRRVAETDSSVVLFGETGTGKELIVEALHRLSRRREGKLVKLNCAAVPETLVESELFGHERGAFTGAVARKHGRFELADGGTLFLDEVAELSAGAQAKLLRAVQEQTFERVGGVETRKVDVRIVAATHRDLPALVRAGAFREDLYYRLAVIVIEVPPLRERGLDMDLLVEQLLRRAARRVRRPVPRVLPEVLDGLRAYRFPGNVRELGNLLERAVTLCQGDAVDLACFPPEIAAGRAPRSPAPPNEPFLPLSDARARFEADHIAAALRRTGGRRGEAADLLGISRKTLWARLAGEGGEAGEEEDDGHD